MNVRDHIQSFFLSAGNYACYALCIIDIAREHITSTGLHNGFIDDLEALIAGVEKGFIFFNGKNYNDPNNFYVAKPAEFLEFLCGDRFTVRKEAADYECGSAGGAATEYAVEFWAWSDSRAAKGTGHFVRPGKNTLQYSKSVACGKCYSKRIFTLAGKK